MLIDVELYMSYPLEKWDVGYHPLFVNNETIILFDPERATARYRVIGMVEKDGKYVLRKEDLTSNTFQGALAISLLVSEKNKHWGTDEYDKYGILSAYDQLTNVINLEELTRESRLWEYSLLSPNESVQLEDLEDVYNGAIISILAHDFRYNFVEDDTNTIERIISRILGL